MLPRSIASQDLSKTKSSLDAATSLVVLSPVGRISPAVETLIAGAVEGLRMTKHNLKLHLGFLDGDQKRPYVVNEWSEAGANSLERRWLMNELRRAVYKNLNYRKLVVYFDEGCVESDLVIAEDLVTAADDSLSVDNAWDTVEFVRHPSVSFANDPYRDTRVEYLNGYRNWINTNPDDMTSIEIAAQLQRFSAKHNCDCQVLEKVELEKKGLNLLCAVGQASRRSPSTLVLVTHNWKPGGLLLVGKGVTFDTGGINVKVFENLVNAMKNDMGGAALMSNLFMALVTSGYAGPLALAVPACENLVAQESMKPGTVLKAYNGKKVFIEHTDAEGRLILADALSYANEQFKPGKTMVAATLTTAVLRQFTNFFTGVHFADPEFEQSLHSAGEMWGECFSVWQRFLPFLEANHTDAADLTNMGRMPSHSQMGGGSNVAAHFLKEFCPSPMLHFDIFATCWNWSSDYPGTGYGATGAPFNSLFHSLRNS